jgi:prevent-host-death family protein
MERINVKEARDNIKAVLDRVESGEEIVILRRGKEVARLVPAAETKDRLPSLDEFRKSIRIKGRAMSRVVRDERKRARY